MDGKRVLFRKGRAEALITLNRPEARNALSSDMVAELAAALDECRDSSIRAVVITGTAGAFCAGADVKDMTRILDTEGPQGLATRIKAMADTLHQKVILAIRRLPKPVIASVNGVAAGAGFSLAVACDLRIVADSARFIPAFANIGMTADGGVSYLLPRLIGQNWAMDLYLTNQPISAHRALELGLVNRVVPASQLERHTAELVTRLVAGPTLAFGRTKALMDRGWSSDLETHLAEESSAISEIASTEDCQEGIRAFVGKRPPKFKGR